MSRQEALTPEQKEQMKKDYADGMTYQDLSEKYFVNTTLVSKVVSGTQRIGKPIRRKKGIVVQ